MGLVIQTSLPTQEPLSAVFFKFKFSPMSSFCIFSCDRNTPAAVGPLHEWLHSSSNVTAKKAKPV